MKTLTGGTMKSMVLASLVAAFALSAGAAKAEEDSDSGGSGSDQGYSFGLAMTIGEGMYFIDHDVYRSPVSLEVVPSLGWSWFKFDLGLSTTLESIEGSPGDVSLWNFTFRPGGRLTPPMIPLYLRVAFPLQFQRNDFDWGLMFGVGLDIHIIAILGIVFEIDTALTNDLEWGGGGIPLEFRIGLSFHF